MTLKAVRVIRSCGVVAVPGRDPRASLAYRIAAAAVPELADKTVIGVDMVMSRDEDLLKRAHDEAADVLSTYLDQGQDVAYLVLGDPTIYSTFSYLQGRLKSRGFPVRIVSGVTSFCAAAAALGMPLATGDEALRVLPGAEALSRAGDGDETRIVMKAGRRLNEVKERLARDGYGACAAENCGLPGEALYERLDTIPDEAGYFTVVIARPAKH